MRLSLLSCSSAIYAGLGISLATRLSGFTKALQDRDTSDMAVKLDLRPPLYRHVPEVAPGGAEQVILSRGVVAQLAQLIHKDIWPGKVPVVSTGDQTPWRSSVSVGRPS